MGLNIEARWLKPIKLKDGDHQSLILWCAEKDIASIPKKTGIYFFFRKHGKKVMPLYVGQSGNLRGRLKMHLKSSVKLMKQIKDEAKTGGKFFMCCPVHFKSGQQEEAVLDVLEGALIEYFLAEGFELYHKQGVKRPSHTISFTGNRTSEAALPRTMRVLIK